MGHDPIVVYFQLNEVFIGLIDSIEQNEVILGNVVEDIGIILFITLIDIIRRIKRGSQIGHILKSSITLLQSSKEISLNIIHIDLANIVIGRSSQLGIVEDTYHNGIGIFRLRQLIIVDHHCRSQYFNIRIPIIYSRIEYKYILREVFKHGIIVEDEDSTRYRSYINHLYGSIVILNPDIGFSRSD